jgi:transposase
MSATPCQYSDRAATGTVLYLALELSWNEWKLGFTTGPAQPVRQRPLRARDTDGLLREIAKAKVRFGLPADAPVRCCYEAGRDGFWLHRFLCHHGIDNRVVDSASIEVNRRARRAKSDRLDVQKLASMLLRYHGGERKLWAVVRVPTVEDEDHRQLHRDLLELKGERTRHVNRIKGLLASVGLAAEVDARLPEQLPRLRTWDGAALPPALQARLLREFARWEFVHRQILDLENERARQIRSADAPAADQVRRLLQVRGIGPNSAWLFVHEFFAWRQIRNRRQLGALAGLVPTPYQSGDSDHEQGISKAGNRRLRVMAIEIAWCWLRYQPGSALSQWYHERLGRGTSRQRRIGIVALARKVLVALWRYLEEGVVPAGAVILAWPRPRRARLPQEPVAT